MIEQEDDLERCICNAATRGVQCYAQGILSVEVLAERMMKEWVAWRIGGELPSKGLLVRLAQRICSRELYAAWCSPEERLRECAFENLKRYLENSLRCLSIAKGLVLQMEEIDEILQQTLSDLFLVLNRNPLAGPNDPAAFLKWTQTILIRNAYASLRRARSESHLSIEAQTGTMVEQLIDGHNEDPEEQVVHEELHQALKNAILSLRNPRYRQVLIYTYLAGMDESELACHLQVQVQDVYLWRHRAIKALRSRPEVMQALRPWLR